MSSSRIMLSYTMCCCVTQLTWSPVTNSLRSLKVRHCYLLHTIRKMALHTGLASGGADRQVGDLPSGCVSTRSGAELSPEPCLFWAITLKMYTVAGIRFWMVTCISPGRLVFSTRSLWINRDLERNNIDYGNF